MTAVIHIQKIAPGPPKDDGRGDAGDVPDAHSARQCRGQRLDRGDVALPPLLTLADGPGQPGDGQREEPDLYDTQANSQQKPDAKDHNEQGHAPEDAISCHYQTFEGLKDTHQYTWNQIVCR